MTEGKQRVDASEGKHLSQAYLTVPEVRTHVVPSICGYSHWVRNLKSGHAYCFLVSKGGGSFVISENCALELAPDANMHA